MNKNFQFVNIEAIVLGEKKAGSADKLLTVFSKEFGKCTLWAPGVRSTRNKLGSSLQLFTHAHIMAKSGSDKFIIEQCEVINAHKKLSETWDKLLYAATVIEITDNLWPERKQDKLAFQTLLSFLNISLHKNERIASLIASWQLISIAGFRPELKQCVCCQQKYNAYKNIYYFCSHLGGIVCHRCQHKICNFIHFPWHKTIHAFFHDIVFPFTWQNFPNFSVKQSTLDATENILNNFLFEQTNTKLNTIQLFTKKYYT